MWTTLWAAWGRLGVLLWKQYGRRCAQPVDCTGAARVTCDNVVHRLWTMESRRISASVPRMPDHNVEVIRSARRRRTVSAYRDGDRTVVRLPAGLPAAEEQRWVAEMLAKLADQDRRRAPSGDAALAARAAGLRRRYVPAAPALATVRWVGNQQGRWGSCTPTDRSIRISERLATLPGWVLDYVLVHELAHLLVGAHDADFWSLVERYPAATRARGFLEGYAAAVAGGEPPADAEPPAGAEPPANPKPDAD